MQHKKKSVKIAATMWLQCQPLGLCSVWAARCADCSGKDYEKESCWVLSTLPEGESFKHFLMGETQT